MTSSPTRILSNSNTNTPRACLSDKMNFDMSFRYTLGRFVFKFHKNGMGDDVIVTSFTFSPNNGNLASENFMVTSQLASAIIFLSRTTDTHTNVKVNEKKIVPNGKNKKQSENPKIFTYLNTNFNIICKILNHEMFPALQFF